MVPSSNKFYNTIQTNQVKTQVNDNKKISETLHTHNYLYIISARVHFELYHHDKVRYKKTLVFISLLQKKHLSSLIIIRLHTQ